MDSSIIKMNFRNPFQCSPVYSEEHFPYTLNEMKMLGCLSEIKRKPNWTIKIFNQDILDKWKKEISNMLDDRQIKYIISELQYNARQSYSQKGIRPSPVENVWEVDNLVSKEIKRRLHDSFRMLESEEDIEGIRWHPGSNFQVLDLVHPSMYPYVHGITKLAPWIDKKLFEDFNKGEREFSSKRYQWLPSEVHVEEDGKVHIISYINNLDIVKYKDLYTIIEEIFQLFIPLFNLTLTDLLYKNDFLRIDDSRDMDRHESFQDWKIRAKLEGLIDADYIDEENDMYGYLYDDYIENRKTIIPEVSAFIPFQYPSMFDLRGRKLQVIVKLAEIILRPENPEYKGGSWHVEGMLNESIVATGIYYLDSENITESSLEFRKSVNDPPYEQNDDRGVEEIYGIQDGNTLNQYLGYLLTKADRCIVFPNIYQHHVRPFSLLDPTKNGYRKLLVFFLVDPNKRIISTADLAPEQNMSVQEAIHHRSELMAERKYLMDLNSKEVYERDFSLCEH